MTNIRENRKIRKQMPEFDVEKITTEMMKMRVTSVRQALEIYNQIAVRNFSNN